MMDYRIRIDYTTGNSLHSENTSDYLEFTWKDLNIAKENLKRIQKHYKMYREINGYSLKRTKTNYEIFEEHKNENWFVNQPKFYNKHGHAITDKDAKKLGEGNYEIHPEEYNATNCIKFIMDNGENLQIMCFWCGYFESLNTAEIEIDHSDLKIEF